MIFNGEGRYGPAWNSEASDIVNNRKFPWNYQRSQQKLTLNLYESPGPLCFITHRLIVEGRLKDFPSLSIAKGVIDHAFWTGRTADGLIFTKISIGQTITVFFDATKVTGTFQGFQGNFLVLRVGTTVLRISVFKILAIQTP
jgi:hypothetical protein